MEQRSLYLPHRPFDETHLHMDDHDGVEDRGSIPILTTVSEGATW
jgi:hypothetical protein